MDDIQEKRAVYRSNFDTHQERINTALNSINRIIFVVITGTFVLSLTFINGFQDMEVINLWMLIISWICLIFTIFGNIYAHYLNMIISANVQSILTNWSTKDKSITISSMIGEDEKNIKFNKRVPCVNYFVFSTLIVGITFLFLFIGSNMYQKNTIIKSKNESNQSL